mgnify:CR=1 FL=1
MSPVLINLLYESTLETLYMVAMSTVFGTLAGLPLGVFLATSRRGEILSAPAVNGVLGLIVNATRSVPFIILVVAIIPFTRALVGTSIGTNAAIVPLTLAAIPFIARLVENAIREVDAGLIEAARAMGERGTGALPVGENGRLVGMVTDRDLAVQEPVDLRLRERHGLVRGRGGL